MWWTLRQHVAEMCNGDKNHNVCTRTWKCCGNMSQGYVAVTSPLVYTDTFFTLGDILSLDMLHKVQLVELHGTHLGIKRCKDDIKLLVYGYATCPCYKIKCWASLRQRPCRILCNREERKTRWQHCTALSFSCLSKWAINVLRVWLFFQEIWPLSAKLIAGESSSTNSSSMATNLPQRCSASNIVLNISRCVSLAVVFEFSSFLFFKFGWFRSPMRSTFNQAGSSFTALQFIWILPSLHNRTHLKVEAWWRWSARPKICLIVTISLQQSG